MTYPEAERFILATAALLEGWCGSAEYYDNTNRFPCVVLGAEADRANIIAVPASGWCQVGLIRLDPLRPEVRDHLLRALSLPLWMRDGTGLEPWQSAGLIACSAAGRVPTIRLSAWKWHKPGYWERGSGTLTLWDDRGTRPHSWRLWLTAKTGVIASGPENGEAGKAVADAAAIDAGCALMLTADSMLLPFPGGVRVWRRG